jgi:hypothetical protein
MNLLTRFRESIGNAVSHFSIDCSDLIFWQFVITRNGVFSCSVLGSMAGAAKVPFSRQKY